MKKISLVGSAGYGGILLTAIQGVLLMFVSIFLVNQQYITAWQSYPTSPNVLTVYLKNMSDKKQPDTLNWLLDTAKHDGLFLVRQDREAAGTGTTGKLRVGVYGEVAKNDVSFTFMGQDILNADNLEKLQTAPNRSSTLGVETGSISSLGTIPGFRFCESVVVKNLPQLVIDSGTVSGTYRIVGLQDDVQKADFINGLSKVSGIAENELTTAASGMAVDSGLLSAILWGVLAVQVFLSILFFLAVTVKNLPKQGKLALLGWSRSSFAKKLLSGFFVGAITEIPILVVVAWLLAGWNQFSFHLLGAFFAAALCNMALVFVELLIASTIIFMTKSLDTIRGRIPKKPLYVLGIMAYLLVSVGIVFCGFSVDKPISQLYENARLDKKWQSVSGYQLLTCFEAGEDSASISGHSNKFSQDVYHWYSSISKEDGVYLIHTTYYDTDVLHVWKNNSIYKTIPEKSFWYFTLSPNYMKKLGITISEKEIAGAEAGTRLYLLPDTLSQAETERMKAYLCESAARGISAADIHTVFTQKQDFEFITYKPSQELFTWGTKADETAEEKAPIIYVSTPENMTYFEDESLLATGMENSYIKFESKETMAQYTSTEELKRFNLTDNGLSFKAVSVYIDGLQKNTEAVLLGLGLGIILLFVMLIGLLLTLATIFRIANQEKINVKKFLGFNFWRLYKAPMCMLSSVIILEIAVMLMRGSKFGSLLMLIIAILQIIIFSRYMARSELKRLLIAFKGE